MKILSLVDQNNNPIGIGNITIFVGSNNTGKSQILSDIRSILSEKVKNNLIIRDIKMGDISSFELISANLYIEKPSNDSSSLITGISSNLLSSETITLDLKKIKDNYGILKNIDTIFGNIGKFLISFIDGNEDNSIFNLGEFRMSDSDSIRDFFDSIISGDPLTYKKLASVYGDAIIPDITDNLKDLGIFSQNIIKRLLEKSKDQRQTFEYLKILVWIFTALLLSQDRIILLDDPDIKMGKEQNILLGKWLAEYYKTFNNQLIIATHNISLLSGIMENIQEISLFQIERQNNKTYFKPIRLEAEQMLLNKYSFLLRGF